MWMGTKTFGPNDNYNPSELNRVNNNIKFLDDTLAALGYLIAITQPKTTYSRTDFPKVSDLNAVRANLVTIKQNFYAISAPDVSVDNTRLQSFDYIKANNIEQNIQALYDMCNDISAELKYCGTLICGQDNTYL